MNDPANNSGNNLPSNAVNRLSRGLASTTLAQIIAAANSILLVSLFLNAWGAEGYGKWLTLTALVTYLTLVDLGGQNFIGNLLAVEYVRGNEGKFRTKVLEWVVLSELPKETMRNHSCPNIKRLHLMDGH